MEFQHILKVLVTRFDDKKIPYALIGAVALGLLGVLRATGDIDFLVRKEDMPVISAIMKDLGYSVINDTENVTQFSHDLRAFGTIDFLHAFRKPTLVMLERAEEKSVFSGEIRIKVVLPEDLIGLKLQAIKNNPELKAMSMQDIVNLVEIHGESMDWKEIETYAKILRMEDAYSEIRSFLKS